MMGAAGGAMAEVVVNVGNNPVNESAPGGGNINGSVSGNPAVEFRGENVNLTATVAVDVNLQGTGLVSPVAVADSTTTNLGTSNTSLVLNGNNTVNGSVTADTITAAGTNLSAIGQPVRTVTFNGNVNGQLTVSGYSQTGAANAVINNSNLNGNLSLTGNGGSNVTKVDLNSGSINGSVSTNQNGYGILNIANTGDQHISGTIGAGVLGTPSAALGSINVSGTGSMTFNATSNTDKQYAYINTLSVGNGATVNLNGGMTGNISNNGTVALESSKNIFGDSISGGGTLNLLGNNEIYGTVSQGTVNAASNVIFDRTVSATNVNVSGTNVLFSGLVTSGNFGFTAGGTATLARGLTGNANFNGNNATLTLEPDQTITGNVDTTANNSGILAFRGVGNIGGSVGTTGSLKEIQANSTGLVSIAGTTRANTVNMNAAGTIAFTGGLDTRYGDNTLGTVNFFNSPGTIQIGNNANLIGNVVTNTNNNGTVTMVSGTQAITGDIGSSTHAINRLNIGGANTGTGLDTSANAFSTTTANGNVFASTVALNNNDITNDSTLVMASGKNLTGTVSTDTHHAGVLTLAGGTQAVTGTVGADGMRLKTINSAANGGASTFTANVFADNVINTGNGSSTFNTDVKVTTLFDIGSGTTEIKGSTTVDGVAGEIRIGTGTGNFNTLGGTTSTTNLNFTGAGTANLNQGLTFTNLNFAGHNATVNLAAGKDLTGTAITTTTNGTGYINLQGGTQTVSAAVGAAGLGLNKITAGLDGATSNFTNGAAVHANTLEVVGNGAVNLSGGLVGNLSYINNVANENGTVVIAAGKNLTGTVTTGSTSGVGGNNAGNQGILTLQGGNQTVSGAVGAAGAALKTINAGAEGSTSIFSSMVHAETLNYSGTGTVALNGTNGGAAASGLIGNVNFNDLAGTLSIGNGVNLTTGNTGTEVANAHNATLTFAGSSTVTGVVGGDTTGRSTFRTINAGAEGSTVTFIDDVYVSDAAIPTTFHVTETGTVNFQGDLHGQLVFNAGGDGVVNVSNGKSIVSGQTPTVASSVTGQGTLNYLGSTTLGQIGTALLKLSDVNFNTSNVASAQTVGSNVYATDVMFNGKAGALGTTTSTVNDDFGGSNTFSIFNTTGTTYTVSNGVTLGGNLTINTPASGSTLVNFANGATNTINGNLVLTAAGAGATLGSNAINLGTAHVAVGGNMMTNGASISTTLDTDDISTTDAGSTSVGSGQITVAGSLTMTGTEKVQVNYVGTLQDAGTYTLINAGSLGGTQRDLGGENGGLVTDNSRVINTQVAQNAGGDLIVIANRTTDGTNTWAPEQLYANRSNTVGHFSNNAVAVIAGLAADGSASGGSTVGGMDWVIQQLELDTYGNNDTAEHLAAQIEQFAPIANASLTQSTFLANDMALNGAGVRLASLRGDTLASSNDLISGVSAGDAELLSGFWVKALGGNGKQKADGTYDGYKTSTWGLDIGVDTKVNRDTIVGVALGYTDTKVDQTDFRSGDGSKIKGWQLMGYASYDVSKEAYVEGTLSYGRSNYDGTRKAGMGLTATSDYDGNTFGARIGAGYRMDLGNKMVFTPMVSLDYTRVKLDAYTETGAFALSQNVAEQSAKRTQFGLGGRLSTEMESNGKVFKPEVGLNWYHASGDLNTDVSTSFVGGGNAFTTPTANVGRNTYNLDLGLAVMTGKTSSVQVRYDLDTRSGFTGHTGSVTGRWMF